MSSKLVGYVSLARFPYVFQAMKSVRFYENKWEMPLSDREKGVVVIHPLKTDARYPEIATEYSIKNVAETYNEKKFRS